MVTMTTAPIAATLSAHPVRKVGDVVLGLLTAAQGAWIERDTLLETVYSLRGRAECQALKQVIWRLRHEHGIAIEGRHPPRSRRPHAYRLAGETPS